MTEIDLKLSNWHARLRETWLDVQTLAFRAGLTQAERDTIDRALALIAAVRGEMNERMLAGDWSAPRSKSEPRSKI
jgi:hypothetical protein